MPSQSYSDILKRAKEELTEAELRQLISELRADRTEASANGSVYDAMARRGLLGKLTTAPADLGTHPIHMEGFGNHAD